MNPRASSRHGFTLIELLVVIAIIAILAAILFPVFAQAKAAAKSTQSLSNIKNLTTATLIYSTDYDDMFMVGATWGLGAGDGVIYDGTGPQRYKTWSYLLQPYIKNADIFFDPQAPAKGRIQGLNAIEYASMRTHYGYNQINLAYYSGSATPRHQANTWYPVSATAPANSSETVLFAPVADIRERLAFDYFNGDTIQAFSVWGIANQNQYVGPVLETSAFPPFCDYDIEMWNCFDWNYWGPINMNTEREEAGFYTGAVTLRRNRQAITAFTDGHVKSLNYARLAGGTDFVIKENIFEDYVVVTDKSKYLWDIE
ncbi:MAG: prepilin-type N-terminal cleavage/methylation domain-containing protein [Armatimonadetes bacterium]|nr:prepilin-type N-terminal cleavage/methylation domain-containing protein [Armatimonadota bacterium]